MKVLSYVPTGENKFPRKEFVDLNMKTMEIDDILSALKDFFGENISLSRIKYKDSHLSFFSANDNDLPISYIDIHEDSNYIVNQLHGRIFVFENDSNSTYKIPSEKDINLLIERSFKEKNRIEYLFSQKFKNEWYDIIISLEDHRKEIAKLIYPHTVFRKLLNGEKMIEVAIYYTFISGKDCSDPYVFIQEVNKYGIMIKKCLQF